MKKKLVLLVLCSVVLTFTACGQEKDADSSAIIESSSVTESEPSEDASASSDGAQGEAQAEILTPDQALAAIKKHCIKNDPGLEEKLDSDDFTIYWDVTTNDANEIVVLYRSYTGAEIRYYVDPATGDAYVTELVPGIIDEEQRTEESLNVKDYLD